MGHLSEETTVSEMFNVPFLVLKCPTKKVPSLPFFTPPTLVKLGNT